MLAVISVSLNYTHYGSHFLAGLRVNGAYNVAHDGRNERFAMSNVRCCCDCVFYRVL